METNTGMGMFILDLRSSSPPKKHALILNHAKSIAKNTKLTGSIATSLLSCHFFLAATQKKEAWLRDLDFVRGASSTDNKVKKFGYLGLSFVDNQEILIGSINTIKKDLENNSLDDVNNNLRFAIHFLSTIQSKDLEFLNLNNSVKKLINSKNEMIKNWSTVIFHRFNDNFTDILLEMKLNLPEIKLNSILLQILIKKLTPVDTSDTNINNIIPDYLITKVFNLFLESSFDVKIRCLQFFSLITGKGVFLEPEMNKMIEKSIDMVKFTKKTISEMGFNVEVIKYFLLLHSLTKNTKLQDTEDSPSTEIIEDSRISITEISGNNTYVVNMDLIQSFIFRMLESKIRHFVLIGIELSLQSKIYVEVALNKCISEGLDSDDILFMFKEMIDDVDLKSIVLDLEGRNLDYFKIRTITDTLINTVLSKINRRYNSKDNNTNSLVKLIIFDPTFCLRNNLSEFLTENDKKKIYLEIKNKGKEYFGLKHQTGLELNEEEIKKIILEINQELELKNTISNLILEENLNYFIELLISSKNTNFENLRNFLINLNSKYSTKNLVKNIFFLNIFLQEKVAYFGNNVFLKYKFYESNESLNLELKYPIFINQIKIYDGLKEIKINEKIEEDGIISKIKIEGSKIRIKINYEFKWYENILEMGTQVKYN